jgi:hypothetical protein
VDELGHVEGFGDGSMEAALRGIDDLLARTLGDFPGELVLTADHGLTATDRHLDVRALVEERVGPTLAFPLIGMPDPRAVVCESGNAMANVYLRGDGGWRDRPPVERCRELARDLLRIDGIDSVAIRGEELHTRAGGGEVAFRDGALEQRGDAFAAAFAAASPGEALACSAGEWNPDAAFALTSLVASERAGDLLVAAAVGSDLRHCPRVAGAPRLPRRAPPRAHDGAGALVGAAPVGLAPHGRSLRARARAGGRRPGGLPAVGRVPARPGALDARGGAVKRALALGRRFFTPIALVGTLAGVGLAPWWQRAAIGAFDWTLAPATLAAAVALFAVPPVLQGVSFLDHPAPPRRADAASRRHARVDAVVRRPLRALRRARVRAANPRAAAPRRHPRPHLGGVRVRAARRAHLGRDRVRGRVRGRADPPAAPRTRDRGGRDRRRQRASPRLPARLGAGRARPPRRGDPGDPARARVAAVVVLNAAGWLATGAAAWLLVDALTTGDPPTLGWLIDVYACAWLLGFVVPLLRGGLGLRDGTLAAFLATAFGAGPAAAVAVALRFANTIGELVAVGATELVYAALRRLPDQRPNRWTLPAARASCSQNQRRSR